MLAVFSLFLTGFNVSASSKISSLSRRDRISSSVMGGV